MLDVNAKSSAAATASAIPIQCGRVASRGLAFIGIVKLVVVNIKELLIIRIGHGVAGRPCVQDRVASLEPFLLCRIANVNVNAQLRGMFTCTVSE